MEIRLGCLQLAAQLLRPTNNYSPEEVVKVADQLYAFCIASPSTDGVEKPVKRKKSTLETDLLS
mgnify:CR=1